MSPSIRLFGVVLTAFFFLCFSPVQACDGIQEKCAPTVELVKRYIAYSDQYGYIPTGSNANTATRFVSAGEGVSAACSDVKTKTVVNQYYVWDGCPVRSNTQTDGSINAFAEWHTLDSFGNPSPKKMTGVYANYIDSVQSDQCKNPLYPKYNAQERMCYKSQKCTAGKTDFQDYAYPPQPLICYAMTGGGGCKARVTGDIQVCPGDGARCFSNITYTGEECSTTEQPNKPPQNCVTGPDGRKICAEDSPNPDAKNGPCVQTSTGVKCVKTESPTSNCQKNPADPACITPDKDSNCGFVGTEYRCTKNPGGCGTFNNQQVCICSNGGSRPWSGSGGSSCAGGTDPVTGGGGQGKNDAPPVNFTGRCGSGQTLNLDCFFENSTDVKPQKHTPEFTELDEATAKIGQPFEHGIAAGEGLFAGVMPATGSCPPLSIDGIPHVGSIAIRMPCDQMTLIRLGFEWLLNIGVVWYVWRRFSETI